MKIVNHPSCTHQLGAPSDMDDGSCETLPVRYEETNYGTFAVSYWQPEAEELELLLAGGALTLHIRAQGRQHPVVALGVQLDYPAEHGGTLDEARQQRIAHLELQVRGLEAKLNEVHIRAQDWENQARSLQSQLELADSLRNKERGLPSIDAKVADRIADWEGGK